MQKRYRVTNHFISGLFAGLTLTEQTDVLFEVGKTYYPAKGFGTSVYIVTKIERI